MKISNPVKISMGEIMAKSNLKMDVTIKITQKGIWKIRMAIGMWLIKLASYFMKINLNLVVEGLENFTKKMGEG